VSQGGVAPIGNMTMTRSGQSLGAAQNGIVDADAMRIVKVSHKDQCKSTRGSALNLKSIYVLSDLYVFWETY